MEEGKSSGPAGISRWKEGETKKKKQREEVTKTFPKVT